MGDIKLFTEYLKDKDSIFKGQIKRFYISSYKEYLLSERYKVSTINKKVNSLHSFNIFLIKTSRMTESVVNISRDKIKIAHGSDKSVEILTDNEVEKILFHIEDEVKVNQRDRMIILILLYTGLRVSELVNIKIDRINFLSSHLEVIGKGGKYREVPLKQEVVKAMKKYLEEDRAVSKYKDSEYLIVTQRDGKAHRDAILKMVKRIGKELDIKIYNHKFRHTFFCCDKDDDITDFTKNKAIEFEKRDRSRTYIYFDEEYLQSFQLPTHYSKGQNRGYEDTKWYQMIPKVLTILLFSNIIKIQKSKYCEKR